MKAVSVALVAVGVGAVAVTGFILVYASSDPIRAVVDQGVRQVTEWTPENIQRDPENYLRWCLDEIDRSHDALEARLIGLSQQKTRAEAALLEASGEREALVQVFNRLRSHWPDEDAATDWPIRIDGNYFTRDELRRRITEAHGRLTIDDQGQQQLREVLAALRSQESKLRDEMERLDSTRSQVATQLEIFLVQQTVEGLDGLRVDVDAMLAAASSISGTDYGADLDSLIHEERARISDDEFRAILNETF